MGPAPSEKEGRTAPVNAQAARTCGGRGTAALQARHHHLLGLPSALLQALPLRPQGDVPGLRSGLPQLLLHHLQQGAAQGQAHGIQGLVLGMDQGQL